LSVENKQNYHKPLQAMTVQVTYSEDKNFVTMPVKQWQKIEKTLLSAQKIKLNGAKKSGEPKLSAAQAQYLQELKRGAEQMVQHIQTGQPELQSFEDFLKEMRTEEAVAK
jgi:hypothetical protein